jgi:hypothetical protein
MTALGLSAFEPGPLVDAGCGEQLFHFNLSNGVVLRAR